MEGPVRYYHYTDTPPGAWKHTHTEFSVVYMEVRKIKKHALIHVSRQ